MYRQPDGAVECLRSCRSCRAVENSGNKGGRSHESFLRSSRPLKSRSPLVKFGGTVPNLCIFEARITLCFLSFFGTVTPREPNCLFILRFVLHRHFFRPIRKGLLTCYEEARQKPTIYLTLQIFFSSPPQHLLPLPPNTCLPGLRASGCM